MAQLSKDQIEKARKDGYSDDEIKDHMRSSGYDESDISSVFQVKPNVATPTAKSEVKKGAHEMMQGNPLFSSLPAAGLKMYQHIEDWLANLGDTARTGASVATGLAATGIAAPTGPYAPAIGNAAGSSIDELLRWITGKKANSPILESDSHITAALENTAIGELGGVALRGVAKGAQGLARGAKELTKTGSVVDQAFPGMRKLDPTYSQYSRPGKSPTAQVIEDVFASKAKKAAVENSVGLAKTEGENLITRTTGKKTALTTSSESLSQSIEQKIQNQFDESIAASERKVEPLKILEEANVEKTTKTITSATTVPSGILDANGKPITKLVPAVTEEVEVKGPTRLEDSVIKAKKFMDEFTTGLDKGDPESPIYKAAQNILETSNAEFDSVGNLVKVDPISFKQAWAWKRRAGELAFGSPYSDMNMVDKRFQPIFYSLDNDIEKSMSRDWKVAGQDAANLYTETKALVNQRHELFNPGGKAGKLTKIFLEDVDASGQAIDSVSKQVNAVLDDSVKLQRTLNIGRADFGNGKMLSSQKGTPLKQDLGAYQLKRLMTDSLEPGVENVAEMQFNTRKIFEAWRDNEKSDSYKMLFSSKAHRDDIEQTFKNFANLDQKMSTGGSNYIKFRAASMGITFTAGMLSYVTGNSALSSSALLGGAITGGMIGLHGFGRLLANPSTARIMRAASSGGALGMSVQQASRLISHTLVGQHMDVELADGSTKPGKITLDKDGKVTFELEDPKE